MSLGRTPVKELFLPILSMAMFGKIMVGSSMLSSHPNLIVKMVGGEKSKEGEGREEDEEEKEEEKGGKEKEWGK